MAGRGGGVRDEGMKGGWEDHSRDLVVVRYSGGDDFLRGENNRQKTFTLSTQTVIFSLVFELVNKRIIP